MSRVAFYDEVRNRATDEVLTRVDAVLEDQIQPDGLTIGQEKIPRPDRIAKVIDDLTRDNGQFWIAYASIAPHFAKQELQQFERDLKAEFGKEI